MNMHSLPVTDMDFSCQEHRERLLRYWKSLLAVQPTGNAMVDAGFHEEMRSALRDALHLVNDLSHQLAVSGEINTDLRQQRSGLMDRIKKVRGQPSPSAGFKENLAP